jgi:hypothetical protein
MQEKTKEKFWGDPHKKSNMIDFKPIIFVLTSKAFGQNTAVERQRLSNRIEKSIYMLSTRNFK